MGGVVEKEGDARRQALEPIDAHAGGVGLLLGQALAPGGGDGDAVAAPGQALRHQLILQLGAAQEGRVEVAGEQDRKGHVWSVSYR